jgi:hypothetical protein
LTQISINIHYQWHFIKLHKVDATRFYWRCVTEYCSTIEYSDYNTEEELEDELESIVCTHLASYTGSCAYYDLPIEWRSNVLCRKYSLFFPIAVLSSGHTWPETVDSI